MNKNQMTLANNRSNKAKRFMLIAMVMMMAMAMTVAPALSIVSANVVNNTTMQSLLNTVVTLVSTAAAYVGVVIIIWGVFQMILAFRREDSEGISKQITTVVVGGVLIGFKALANTLKNLVK